jgi:PEP-CTERM motif
MRRISLVVLFALLLVGTVGAGMARADMIIASGVATQTIGPSADTITLNPASNTYTITSVPTIVTLQTFTFSVGESGQLKQDIPLTLSETVTINGDSQLITITADDDVSACCDTLTISAGPSTYFPTANVWLTPQAFASTFFSLGDARFELSAEVSSAPEPATLGLMGAALAGLALLRRKF